MAQREVQPPDDSVRIRPASREDREQVERLLREGLLPDYVDYESRAAQRIRQSLGSEREKFLVAEAQGRVIGTIALIEGSPDAGHLHWLRVDPRQADRLAVARRLARAAAEHAREVGLLKLALHAPASAEPRVVAYCHLLGFEHSRTREIDGIPVLEFYLNLYEKPPITRGG